MASNIRLSHRIVFGLASVVVAAIAARAVYQRFTDDFSPPTASTQVEKLVAKLNGRAECDPFRAKLQAQAGASPAAGATQYAIAETWQAANRAGCIEN